MFDADKRVRAMWRHDALARGTAAAASDMDISVATTDDGFDGFGASWRDWLAAITPTLTAPPITVGESYALTPSRERFRRHRGVGQQATQRPDDPAVFTATGNTATVIQIPHADQP